MAVLSNINGRTIFDGGYDNDVSKSIAAAIKAKVSLSGMALSYQNIYSVDFDRSVFHNMKLIGCVLMNCNLTGCNFSGLNLYDGGFEQSDLTRCNLSNANLERVEFLNCTMGNLGQLENAHITNDTTILNSDSDVMMCMDGSTGVFRFGDFYKLIQGNHIKSNLTLYNDLPKIAEIRYILKSMGKIL